MRSILRSRAFQIGIVAIVIGIGLCFTASVHEDISFAMAPTAARAYNYGSKHFDARDARDYDLERAEYFFNQALQLDPHYLGIHHQLGRIAFLRGNLTAALGYLNDEIALPNHDISSYYVRALIEGFMGSYAAASHDYEIFLKAKPTSWAGINDYSWVLLKAGKPRDALVALDWGLRSNPDNPWLLNSRATALYELGYLQEAKTAVDKAHQAVQEVTEEQWLRSYPGNDPLIAKEGIVAFKTAVEANMHTITLALEKEKNNVR